MFDAHYVHYSIHPYTDEFLNPSQVSNPLIYSSYNLLDIEKISNEIKFLKIILFISE
jgi:hypothetical protein